MTIFNDALKWLGKQARTGYNWIGKHVVNPIGKVIKSNDILKTIYNATIRDVVEKVAPSKITQFIEFLEEGGSLSKGIGILHGGSRILEKAIDLLRGRGLTKKEIIDALKADLNSVKFGLELAGAKGGTAGATASAIGDQIDIDEGVDILGNLIPDSDITYTRRPLTQQERIRSIKNELAGITQTTSSNSLRPIINQSYINPIESIAVSDRPISSSIQRPSTILPQSSSSFITSDRQSTTIPSTTIPSTRIPSTRIQFQSGAIN